jgi:hypothetical protein
MLTCYTEVQEGSLIISLIIFDQFEEGDSHENAKKLRDHAKQNGNIGNHSVVDIEVI